MNRTTYRWGLFCAISNLGYYAICVALDHRRPESGRFFRPMDLLVYGLFAVIALRFNVWPRAYNVIRFLALLSLAVAFMITIFILQYRYFARLLGLPISLIVYGSVIAFTCFYLNQPKEKLPDPEDTAALTATGPESQSPG